MNKLFDIKRTKMIDEAAFMHKPSTFGRMLWPFLLVVILTSMASGLIIGIATTIYSMIVYTRTGAMDEMTTIMQNDGYHGVMSYLELNPIEAPWWLGYIGLFSSAVVIFGAIFYCVKIEKRSIFSMGIRKKGVALELLWGFLIGAIFVGIVFCVFHFSGAITFVRHQDARIIRPSIIFYFLGFLVQAFADELLYRGYFLTSLARDIRPVFAALLGALVFSLFNFYTIFSFLNSFLFAFLLNIYVLKRGSIWGSMALRFTWNFGYAVILGGAGLSAAMFVPKYNANFFTGFGDFESGLLFTILLVCAIMIVLLLKTNKNERSCVEIEYFN